MMFRQAIHESMIQKVFGVIPAVGLMLGNVGVVQGADAIEFNRDIRRILSENCFQCHGPDAGEKKVGKKALRLDLQESAYARRGDRAAIVPGKPDESELIRRITTSDPDDRMPPSDSGKSLKAGDADLLRAWIQQGAGYSRHWAYVRPVRTVPPSVQPENWALNPIDQFVLARMKKEGLSPSLAADGATLLRRAALDLTGIPPTVEEQDLLLADRDAGAYLRMVDRLLEKKSFGEHWARLWLDQARYADSTGYADDPARTIWAYRDYVIRALNDNKPFDQFTIEQLAGDLLPDPDDDQLVATAFHRNTMTNNEGGTNDEEYRNVAVVDRVNTTMAVWMGTTMACAQCHNHKYDPITQDEYFRMFAILNNTADADRGDESPLHALYTPEQKQDRQTWQKEIARLTDVLKARSPELDLAQKEWEKGFQVEPVFEVVRPRRVTSLAGAAVEISDDSTVRAARGGKTDSYSVEIPGDGEAGYTAVRFEVLPDDAPPGRGVGHADGNFVLTGVQAIVAPVGPSSAAARYVRIELPGKEKILSLAEVQVFQGTNNIARSGQASQINTAHGGLAGLATDGNTDGHFFGAKSTTHTETTTDPWWELDLHEERKLDRIVIWNRTDGAGDRLSQFRVIALDSQRGKVWEQKSTMVPSPSATFRPDGGRAITFSDASADFSGKDFQAGQVLKNPDATRTGWSVAPKFGEAHALTLIPSRPLAIGSGSNLVVTLEQNSKFEHATIGRFRVLRSKDSSAVLFARTPAPVLAALRVEASSRTADQQEEVRRQFVSVTPLRESERQQLAMLKQKLSDLKPYTTVPILKELAADQRRKTMLQRRGNYLDLGHELTEGLPVSIGSGVPARQTAQTAQADRTDRLALARWLVDPENPLTARVTVNRLWESVFGIGLVRTCEEFGSQGEPPTHPELLDWLAVELVESKWDVKHLLRLMVGSATYRQTSRVTPELLARDPENRFLARGPRFRLSAEMIRDQALAVSGLLSPKMYGAPVKPQQPKLGLSAAFGSATDWETSSGEDRYRRALYTTWRRSNPYPSMATFDAPNREVCQVRRERSNTPLQALVTLNDPVYIEAAQALSRKMAAAGTTDEDHVRQGFRLCLGRAPTAEELSRMLKLHAATRERYRADLSRAREMATKPLGELPEGADLADMAAWTVVGNVLLNLDEMLMKP